LTPVRSIPSDFDPVVVAAIDERLRRIKIEHNVRIAWAIESGSRAWGFPSPDSDYDCRFIYVRPLDDYLRLSPKRDVIEVPIAEGLDINGWDIFKMARLLVKGNAAAIEWLMSPIIYQGMPGFQDEWCAEAEEAIDRAALMRHYYHLGQGQFLRHLTSPEALSLKKVFYVLRPAVVLLWMRMHPNRRIAPMHLPSLLASIDISDQLRAEIKALLAQKAVTREMGTGPFPKLIMDFIHSEYEQAKAFLNRIEESASANLKAITQVEDLVRRWVRCQS
jgi:uncharacterized protein